MAHVTVSSSLIQRNAELSADDLDGWWLSHRAEEGSEKGPDLIGLFWLL